MVGLLRSSAERKGPTEFGSGDRSRRRSWRTAEGWCLSAEQSVLGPCSEIAACRIRIPCCCTDPGYKFAVFYKEKFDLCSLIAMFLYQNICTSLKRNMLNIFSLVLWFALRSCERWKADGLFRRASFGGLRPRSKVSRFRLFGKLRWIGCCFLSQSSCNRASSLSLIWITMFILS